MLVRVVGYILNEEKQLFIALTAVFGIGKMCALKICNSIKLDPYSRTKLLDNKEINMLNEYIYKNYKVGDDLKKELISNIKQAISSGSYHGKKLKAGLPAHGQKSRSNARTSRKIRI